MKITETYTGGDATLEILIMLLGAFILGWILRWLYDTYLFEYIDEEVVSEKKDDKEDNSIKNIKENFDKGEKEILVKDKNTEDDLKIIEGIGPKIESLLKSSDVKTFEILSEITPDQIRDILREKGGERYAFHDPTTWPDQARLAFENRLDELKEYQDFLSGGKV